MPIVHYPSSGAERLFKDIVVALNNDPAKIIAVRRALMTLRTPQGNFLFEYLPMEFDWWPKVRASFGAAGFKAVEDAIIDALLEYDEDEE